MLVILVRTVILYLIVLVTIRIMGKSELSKMSPFQLVIIFMIAELAAIPIESPTVSLINGVVAIFTLMFLQVLISILSIKNQKLKVLFGGKPSILIDKGKINEKELKNLRITLEDLLEQLRIGNSPSIADVDFAIMESNGQMSVIPKPGKKPLTPDDMEMMPGEETLPAVIISDGTLYKKNLPKVGKDMDELKSALEKADVDKIEDVFLAFCDEQGLFHIYMDTDADGMMREVIPCGQ